MFERGVHLGEEAELYALGQLSEDETERLERHVRECAQCASRVGEAEATMLHLIETGAEVAPIPLRRSKDWHPPRKPGYAQWIVAAAAVAAAFVLGMLLPKPPSAAVVETAMLQGHFLHAQLVPNGTGAPQAKVVYARDGGWFYVLVGAAQRPLDVVLIASGERATVATIAPSSDTRAAFVREKRRFDTIELDDGGKPVATAKLVYPASR